MIADLVLAISGLLGFSVSEQEAVEIFDGLAQDEQSEIEEMPSYSPQINTGEDYTYGFFNPLLQLENDYEDYSWELQESREVADVSNFNPVNIGGLYFPESEVISALDASTSQSNHGGGCGPRAIIGICDYFSRAMSYGFETNPSSSTSRIALATEVFNTVTTHETSSATLTYVGGFRRGFDDIVSNHSLSSLICQTKMYSVFGWRENGFWANIVANISEGMPVTLSTYDGAGDFGGHYSNIFGYEIWQGFNSTTNEQITKKLLKAKMNWGSSGNPFEYCYADILGRKIIGLISYHYTPTGSYDFSPSAAQTAFSNPIYPSSDTSNVVIAAGHGWLTNRLRCGVPEAGKIVFSPNKTGFGDSYLTINPGHTINELELGLSAYGFNEGFGYETIQIQYLKQYGTWENHVSFMATTLPLYSDGPQSKLFLFPNTTIQIRVRIIHPSPMGNDDSGRVVLSAMTVHYVGFDYPYPVLENGGETL